MIDIEQGGLQYLGISEAEIATPHISLGKSEREVFVDIVDLKPATSDDVNRDLMPELEFSSETGLSVPKVLLFDLGHVFLDARYKTIYQAFEDFGVSPEKTRLIFTINEYYDFSRGRIDGHTFCEALRLTLDTPNLTDEQIREIHDKHIFGSVPGMVGLLESVTQKYGSDNIVFVTDACDWQTARQQQIIDLNSYRVIASSEVGMLKSDPEIVDDQGHRRSFFLYVLGELNLQPQEALLIDDSSEKISTAKGYGMQTIKFEGEIQLETVLRERNILK